MSTGNKYFTASIYYVIGNIIGQGVVLLSSGYFTRMMSKADYGLVNTYAAWVLVLNTFIGLNLFITVRNAYLDYRENYHRYTSSILLFSLIAYLVLTVLIFSFIVVMKLKVDKFAFFLASIQAISVHTINFKMSIFAMENNYKVRTLLMVLPNILHTVLSMFLIVVYTKNQYYGKIIGNVVGLAIIAGIIVFFEFKREKPIISKEYWKYAAIIAVPGIMHTLSDLLLMQSDRIMLTEISSADDTAVYSLVYNIGSILVALYTAVNGAWTPYFYKKISQKNYEDVKCVQCIYIKFFTLISLGLLSISPEIIKILSPKTYWSGIEYVNLIVFASFLIYIFVFFSTYLMYLKKAVTVAKNTSIAAGINICLNYVLIGEYKALGASIATVVSYLLLLILHYWSVKKYDDNMFCKKYMLRSIIIMTIYCVIFDYIKHNLVVRYLVVLLIVMVIILELVKIKKKK